MTGRHHLPRTPDHAARARPAPPDGVEVETLMLSDDGVVPNNPDLPLVVMRAALPAHTAPGAVEALIEANGWVRVWRWRVYEYQHYHPNAHEVLACVAGWADLNLGGPSGPILRVLAGDVLVLPAGTGHCQVAAGSDFAVCGAYPPGQEDRETRRGLAEVRGDAVERIAALALPQTDPIYGAEGPLLRAWRPAAGQTAAGQGATGA